MSALAMGALAQDVPIADPGSLAFEEGRWQDVIDEYRLILAASPTDRLSLLRIAQAQRELGRHELALQTLEDARSLSAPEAMVDFERARNLLALGRSDEALGVLELADHAGLRAFQLLDESSEFDSLRDERAFQRVYISVRSRVYPCEGAVQANEFDFWLGRWEVRQPDGTLAGHNTITKRDGGCTIHEQWEGAAGSTGTSVTFYVPSREQWRQIWVGSGATLIDMTGGLVDGEMHLEGQLEYAATGRVVAFRATWTQAPDGRVRQRMEEFDLATSGWRLWFDGFYRRVEGP
jgi:hypothetical protein